MSDIVTVDLVDSDGDTYAETAVIDSDGDGYQETVAIGRDAAVFPVDPLAWVASTAGRAPPGGGGVGVR